MDGPYRTAAPRPAGPSLAQLLNEIGTWGVTIEDINAICFERLRQEQIAKREAERRLSLTSTVDVPVPKWTAKERGE